MYKLPLFALAIVCVLNSVVAQKEVIDSLLIELDSHTTRDDSIKTIHLLFGRYVNYKSDSSLIYAQTAMDLSSIEKNPELYGQSILNYGHALFVNNKLDTFKHLLTSSIPFYREHKKHFWLSAVYRNLALYGEATQQPDTSLYYLNQCLNYLQEYPDSLILGDVYLSQGFAYRTKGYYELSIQSLIQSQKIFNDLNKLNRKGYASQNLGLTYFQSGRLEKGIESNLESIDYFLQMNNERAASQSYNNVGTYQSILKKYDESKSAHLRSIELAKQTKQHDVLIDNYLNICDIYFDVLTPDSIQLWLNRATTLAYDINDEAYLANIFITQAKFDLLHHNKRNALSNILKAIDYLPAIVDPQQQMNAYEDVSEIFGILDQPTNALTYWKKAEIIDDSLFTLKRDQQVEELNLIYETEKKDSEITLLYKNAQIDSLRKKALWGGLLALSLLSLVYIYNIQQKRKREKVLYEKEQELSLEKSKNLELELELKQKELTAKVLQLASKNEFLGELKSEVNLLQSTVDSEVKTISQKISKKIQYDKSDDEMWTQFSKEFSSIHTDFIDNLSTQFGPFSKAEIRLISLLKMNLSTKDIANILRISVNGIKKAKYRLRKKIELPTEKNLQTFIVSYHS